MAAVLLALSAAGCTRSGDATLPVLPFPEWMGAFERVEAPVKGRSGILAGYQLLAPSGSVIATVQRRPAPGVGSLAPALDKGPSDSAAVAEAELARSIAQIHRFYPDARTDATEPFLVLRGGRLRPGRSAGVEYQEEVDGLVQTMKMDVKVVCCTDGHEVVEYRFRHTGAVTADPEESAFLRGFPWTTADVTP
jgi:hypothetical protein